MKIDLHIHTTASDGRATPTEVVYRAAELEMKAIAITDHDSVEGIEEALAEARKFPKLLVIPGVELGADVPNGEMHILGYFVDHYSAEFCHKLEMLRSSRATRGQKMVSKLIKLGIHLNWEHVISISAGASIGRPHIAQAMLERGFISSLQEAFDKYIGDNGPCYVDREKLTPAECVELVAKTGGLPVLAHPAKTDDMDAVLPQLKQSGLIGMEVYYKNYPQKTQKRLLKIANKHGLVGCGGSDYHGFEDTSNNIGNCNVPQETIDRLIALQRDRYNRNTL
ncbi:MAG: PHP domain-containing protein [Chloroflexi bacterium]|jgi:3',5'-nucleoside bisphosphate phosphatase|nr:PHP domain-containing protein [Chloroflexota bacterium]